MLDRDRIIKRAEDVFGDPEKASMWLRQHNRVLGNVRPVDLLDTPEGVQQVEIILGRIEHGVYS